jgi:hypothetical protein
MLGGGVCRIDKNSAARGKKPKKHGKMGKKAREDRAGTGNSWGSKIEIPPEVKEERVEKTYKK